MRVEGLKDLQAQLLQLGYIFAGKKLAAAARKAFLPVLEDARNRVPSDTGALRESLRVTRRRPKKGDLVVRVGLRIDARAETAPGQVPPSRRWHFIEFGTKKLAAKPFLRPALDGSSSTVIETLKDELARAISREVKKRARAARRGAR